MLKKELTPKTTALVAACFVALCAVTGFGLRMMQTQKVKQLEVQLDKQRDREMGVPDLGLRAGATEAEREAAKNKMLEDKMTDERNAETRASAGY